MRIEELKQIAAARTPGPWRCFENHPLHDGAVVGADGITKGGIFVCSCATGISKDEGIKDGHFIATAANTYNQLLKIAEAAKRLEPSQNYDQSEIDLREAIEELEALP